MKKFQKVEKPKNGIMSTKFLLRCTPSVILGPQTLPAVAHTKRSVDFKMSFWGLQISKNNPEFFPDVIALVSKKRSKLDSLTLLLV